MSVGKGNLPSAVLAPERFLRLSDSREMAVSQEMIFDLLEVVREKLAEWNSRVTSSPVCGATALNVSVDNIRQHHSSTLLRVHDCTSTYSDLAGLAGLSKKSAET
eukprot:4003360-Pyramimonas_sp.AAC.1